MKKHFRAQILARRVSAAFIVCLFVKPVAAEPEDKKSYNLPSLVSQTLSRAEIIASQKARISEKELAAKQSTAWQNPNLSFSAGGRVIAPSIGPLFEVGLSQLFYFPGKQALRGEVGNADKKLAELDLAQTELGLTAAVTQAAYEYNAVQQKTQFALRRKKRFELIHAYLAGRIFPSPQKKAESVIVRERLRNLDADTLNLQSVLQKSFTVLDFYVGFPSTVLPSVEVPWLKGQKEISQQEIEPKVLANNIEILSQDNKVSKSLKEKDLASKDAWPDLTVSAFYSNGVALEREHNFGLGIGLPIPAFNRNQYGFKSAEQQVTAERDLLTYKQRQVANEMQQLLVEYEAARKIARQYPADLIASLEKKMEEAQDAFRKGRMDFVLFLELDVQVAETAVRVFDAQISLSDKIARLLVLAADKSLVSQLSSF